MCAIGKVHGSKCGKENSEEKRNHQAESDAVSPGKKVVVRHGIDVWRVIFGGSGVEAGLLSDAHAGRHEGAKVREQSEESVQRQPGGGDLGAHRGNDEGGHARDVLEKVQRHDEDADPAVGRVQVGLVTAVLLGVMRQEHGDEAEDHHKKTDGLKEGVDLLVFGMAERPGAISEHALGRHDQEAADHHDGVPVEGEVGPVEASEIADRGVSSSGIATDED